MALTFVAYEAFVAQARGIEVGREVVNIMAKFADVVNYYKDYRAIACASIAASSGFELVDLAVPYAIGQLLNVLSDQPVDRLAQGMASTLAAGLGQTEVSRSLLIGLLLSIIFLATVVRAPIKPWVGVWFHWGIALQSRRDHAVQVVRKLLSLPLGFYDDNNPGRIAGRVARGLSNHTWTYPDIAGLLIPKLVRVIGIFVIIWIIDWPIALLFLCSFIVILGFSMRALMRLNRKEQALDTYMETTESRTSEIITNIKTVKAFATEQDELKRQQQRLNRELKVVMEVIHRGYVNLMTWQQWLIQSCVFGVLVLTLVATLRGQISLGHFVTTLTVSSMAYAEMEPISNLAEIFARRYASMVRFHEFLQLPTGVEAASMAADAEAITRYQFTGKVHFENVTFGYDRERPILQDINLLIQPKQTVALVGRSGSGKSTLVKLLFRYFEPQQGRILIDGEDIRKLDITGYRKQLAIVHQEVDVFNGTLLENLTYGNPQATREQVTEACEIARVDEFVRKMPQGYGTIVGERGLRLSGGQRQRLGIARALLMDPDVLVFDEATSSLDYESERAIQLAMRSILGTRTTLIIAHRLSTVRDADVIVVMDQGRILEMGSHDDLITYGGLYHRLHTLQETGDLLG